MIVVCIMIISKKSLPEAYQLFHQGVIALAQMEANGFRIDVEYLNKTIKEVVVKVASMEEKLKSSKTWKIWKERFREKTKIGARAQLGEVFFGILGYEGERTDGGKQWKTDDEQLDKVKHPFLKLWRRMEKLSHNKRTFLDGIKEEVIDGYLHPVFNLHLARSYRSSSDSPNSQNWPNREAEMGEMIRRCFIPRKDYHIVEVDFKGAEICLNQAYNQDPVLLDYIKNSPPKDMHRDMTMQIFFIKDPKQVSKLIRNDVKANFVFAQFYGSYYAQCAPPLWELRKEKTIDGKPLKELLEENGIRTFHQFENHIREIEQDFWENRFKAYKEWKDKWWQTHQQEGGFLSLTGFYCNGLSGKSGTLSKNDFTNYAPQGSSFHCLLWTIIQVQNWLNKNKMRSKLVGQIHDSIIGDIHKDELQVYLTKVNKVVTIDLPNHWKWLTAPMKVECEVSSLGESWWDKEPWILRDGIWGPKREK